VNEAEVSGVVDSHGHRQEEGRLTPTAILTA
jgi:hypothetical protein